MFRYLRNIVFVSLFFIFFSTLSYNNAQALFSKETENINSSEEDINGNPILVDVDEEINNRTTLDKIIEVNIESKSKPEIISKEVDDDLEIQDEIVEKESVLVPDFKYNELIININEELNDKIDSIHQELRYLIGLNIIFVLFSFIIFKKAIAKKKTFY